MDNSIIMNGILSGIQLYILCVIVSILFYSAFLLLSTKILGFWESGGGTALTVTVTYAFFRWIVAWIAGIVIPILYLIGFPFLHLESTIYTIIFVGAYILGFVIGPFLLDAAVFISIMTTKYEEGVLKLFLVWLIATLAMSLMITALHIILPALLGIDIRLYIGYDIPETIAKYTEILSGAQKLIGLIDK